MFRGGVHRNNVTFIPLLNTFLIYFKPMPTTKLIYLRKAVRLPSKVFLDFSGVIYSNDILDDTFRNFYDHLCVSCPCQCPWLKLTSGQHISRSLKLFYILHYILFPSVFDKNNPLRILFQPSLFKQRGKIYKQCKTKIKRIVLFVLISTYFERTREGKHSVQFSRISSD
jgi:hypothetical protein